MAQQKGEKVEMMANDGMSSWSLGDFWHADDDNDDTNKNKRKTRFFDGPIVLPYSLRVVDRPRT
jgi:hypothetical protein